MTSVEDRLREALHQVGSKPIGQLDFELLARRRRRRVRTRWTGAITLTAAAAAILSWGAAGRPDAGQATLHPIPASPSIGVVLAENSRELATALSGRTLSGDVVSLAQLRGRIVVLNFCRSMLPACHRQEVRVSDLPATLAGYGRSAPGPAVTTLGVAVRDSTKAAFALVKDQAIGYPIVVDQTGTIASAWDADSLPYTLIIDAQGRIAGRYPGETSQGQLFDAIARVAAGPLGQLDTAPRSFSIDCDGAAVTRQQLSEPGQAEKGTSAASVKLRYFLAHNPFEGMGTVPNTDWLQVVEKPNELAFAHRTGPLGVDELVTLHLRDGRVIGQNLQACGNVLVGKNKIAQPVEYASIRGTKVALSWENGKCGDNLPLDERLARIDIHEDAAAVHVVLVTEANPAARRSTTANSTQVCAGVGTTSTNTVTLKAPLGNRTLYDDARAVSMPITIQQ